MLLFVQNVKANPVAVPVGYNPYYWIFTYFLAIVSEVPIVYFLLDIRSLIKPGIVLSILAVLNMFTIPIVNIAISGFVMSYYFSVPNSFNIELMIFWIILLEILVIFIEFSIFFVVLKSKMKFKVGNLVGYRLNIFSSIAAANSLSFMLGSLFWIF
jgi:hypothetical protein